MRAFRLLGGAQRAALARQAAGRVQAWAAHWGLSWWPGAVHVQPADAAPPPAGGPPQRWRSAACAGALAHADAAQAATLAALAFGPAARQQPSALADAVAERLLDDLLARCLPDSGQAVAASHAPAAVLLQRASGAVCVTIATAADAAPPADASGAVEPTTLQLWLDDAAAQALLAADAEPGTRAAEPPARLWPRAALVGEGRVTLRGWAGSAEIDVATLQALAVGDVVRLDLPIDQPLRLTVDGGDGGLADARVDARRAFLGRVGDRRALCLADSTADPAIAGAAAAAHSRLAPGPSTPPAAPPGTVSDLASHHDRSFRAR